MCLTRSPGQLAHTVADLQCTTELLLQKNGGLEARLATNFSILLLLENIIFSLHLNYTVLEECSNFVAFQSEVFPGCSFSGKVQNE